MTRGGSVNVTTRPAIDRLRTGTKVEEPAYSFARTDTTCAAVPHPFGGTV